MSDSDSDEVVGLNRESSMSNSSMSNSSTSGEEEEKSKRPKDLYPAEFFNACASGDMYNLMLCMKDGIDVNMTAGESDSEYQYGFDSPTVSGIMLAAREGHMDVVKTLLRFDADFSKVNQYYTKALVYASRENQFDQLQELLMAGLCDHPQFRHEDLMTSVQHGDFEETYNIILSKSDDQLINDRNAGNNHFNFLVMSKCPTRSLMLLIDRGVAVNGYDRHGFTPLICAVLTGNVDCITSLVKKGANVNQQEDVTLTDDLECLWVLDTLDKKTFPDNDYILNSNGKTALMYAVWIGKLDVVKCLLNLSADTSIVDSQKRSPLVHAVYYGSMDIVDMLLSHGADIVNHYGYADGTCPSGLFDAINAGDVEIVKRIWNAGVDINAASRKGKTPLILAAEIGKTEIIDLFLKSGRVDINSADFGHSERTALMYAAQKGHSDCVRLLIKAGANQDMIDHHGDTAAEIAAKGNDLKCFQVFMENMNGSESKSNVGDKFIHSASLSKNTDLLQLCVDSCKDIDVLNSQELSPLMCAAEEGILDSVKLLLTHGANVNLQNDNGESAVMLALEQEGFPCFRFLIEAGADVNCVRKDGETLLILAARTKKNCFLKFLLKHGSQQVNTVSSSGHLNGTPLISAINNKSEKAVKLLLAHGADINVSKRDGTTPLMHAAKKGFTKVFKLLLKAGANADAEDDIQMTVLPYALYSSECLEVLIKDGCLFGNDGKLKRVHAETGIFCHLKWDFRCLFLLFEFDIFNWDWYAYSDKPIPLSKLSFAAVYAGYSPCLFKSKIGEMTSLLKEAFLNNDYLTARYLLANLFFTIEDYKTIGADQDFVERVEKVEDVNDETISLLHHITSQPWSLETLSFLTLSSSLSSRNQSGQTRSEQVDSLKLPEMFKSKLKFKRPLYNLCKIEWQFIGRPSSKKEENLLSVSRPIYPYEQDLIACDEDDCESCENFGTSIPNAAR